LEVSNVRYGNFAIFLHWLMVILICILFGLGWYMVDLPKGSDERSWFFALHKSVGLTTALIAFIRLGWRYFIKPPALPAHIPQWERRLAEGTHVVLYIFMVVQPVSGYISSSFSGYSTKFWGIPLPTWGWKDPVLNELFTNVHVASSIVLLSFILLHLAGAMYHAVSARDEILKRMLPVIHR
jgi:cytochrome b561